MKSSAYVKCLVISRGRNTQRNYRLHCRNIHGSCSRELWKYNVLISRPMILSDYLGVSFFFGCHNRWAQSQLTHESNFKRVILCAVYLFLICISRRHFGLYRKAKYSVMLFWSVYKKLMSWLPFSTLWDSWSVLWVYHIPPSFVFFHCGLSVFYRTRDFILAFNSLLFQQFPI